jgi:hypothetical protein
MPTTPTTAKVGVGLVLTASQVALGIATLPHCRLDDLQCIDDAKDRQTTSLRGEAIFTSGTIAVVTSSSSSAHYGTLVL